MLIFFDCEVFKHDWLFVMILPESQETITIYNDEAELKQFYEQHIDDIWIGYNVRHYDQYILKGVLLDFYPYNISQHIINGGQGWQYSNVFNKIKLNTFDIMTTMQSLKELEGFMGNNIQETEVSFDIQRTLTMEEMQSVIKYCTHDVEQTIEVFINRKEEFDSQISLLKAFNLPLSYINKTKAQLAAVILKANKQDRDDEFNITIPETVKISKYWEVPCWYMDQSNHDYDKTLEVWVSGMKHIFAWGGLHGALDGYQGEGLFLSVDVASYYPALMIEYDFLSRNVSDPKLYREIRDTRLELKAKKDLRQAPYKIVLNSTYGAMKAKFNGLYDPLQANNVCVNGQLLLLDLIEKLEPHWILVQSNTDGLIGKVEPGKVETIKSICAEWEKRTRMVLEFETYSKIVQKDVNNYIVIHEDGTYKSKGAYVKKLSALDNDLPIVNKALVEYFINDVPVEVTINSCSDLMMFQKVVKVSSKYMYAMHGENRLSEKCLRVFASKDNSPGVYKVKANGRKEKIANTPQSCFIVNDNVQGRRISRKLDKSWYIDLARKRINDYVTEELSWED